MSNLKIKNVSLLTLIKRVSLLTLFICWGSFACAKSSQAPPPADESKVENEAKAENEAGAENEAEAENEAGAEAGAEHSLGYLCRCLAGGQTFCLQDESECADLCPGGTCSCGDTPMCVIGAELTEDVAAESE